MKRSIQPDTLINQDHNLTQGEQDAKYQIIDRIIARGGPVPAKELEIDEAVLASVIRKGAIVVEDGMVNFAYPVSGPETVHRVTLKDGRRFSSMCAIDAMGTSFTFGQDVEIQDQCAMTGEAIRLRIQDGKITEQSSDQIHVIHVDLKAFDNWSASCWNVMNFFRGEKEMVDYFNANELDPDTTYGLTLAEALKVSKATFERREAGTVDASYWAEWIPE